MSRIKRKVYGYCRTSHYVLWWQNDGGGYQAGLHWIIDNCGMERVKVSRWELIR